MSISKIQQLTSRWGGVLKDASSSSNREHLDDDVIEKNASEYLRIFRAIETTSTIEDLRGQVKSVYIPLKSEPFQVLKEALKEENPLVYLIKNKSPNFLVKMLLDRGIDFHQNDEAALRTASNEGNFWVVKLLIERGANIHCLKESALRWASHDGHYSIVKLLLDRGADLHALNDEALRYAAERGHLHVVKLLVNRGASLTDMVFYRAAEKGRHSVVEFLIGRGVNVDVAEGAALQWAAYEGHYSIVELLLDHGANIHARNDLALTLTCTSGQLAVAELLLSRGATQTQSALEIAIEKGRWEIVDLFSKN